MKGRWKREIPEKTRRPKASSSTIPTCENPVTQPGIEPVNKLGAGGRPPATQSFGAPPIWDAEGSGFESRTKYVRPGRTVTPHNNSMDEMPLSIVSHIIRGTGLMLPARLMEGNEDHHLRQKLSTSDVRELGGEQGRELGDRSSAAWRVASGADISPPPTNPTPPITRPQVWRVRDCQTTAACEGSLRRSPIEERSRIGTETVAPLEFGAGVKIEIKFISNCRNWLLEISIRDQQPSSTNTARARLLGGGKLIPTALVLLYYAMHGLKKRDFNRGHQRLHTTAWDDSPELR
ncbi:hypothetical protein PR048_016850 [Dryococelus australis]|uniref:Uncharacterized protein n=1 Tax=Dryococelus australis TaxID=614101 RepID=A0ABQ9H7U1_9NEOP|nr:hypothetical protein PR048_016850 [Dryococelus australis]